jgi:putative ABC transport system permease protein
MSPISRGIRNAFRNTIRTFSIVIILGISVGLSLSMLVARQAVQDKINTVKSSIGNTIAVSPAGLRGFEGGGEALTADDLAIVSKITNVTSIAETLSDRLTPTNTSLQSAIDAGSLGNRAQSNSGVGFEAPPSGEVPMKTDSSSSTTGMTQITRTFTPPVTIIGVNDATSTTIYGGDSVTFTSGEAIDATKDENVAVIGKSIAEKNSLVVGSTFTAYGKDIKVVGIYDTGNTFSNNGVIMPLVTLQRLSDQTGAITSATVTVNSVDNIDGAVTAIKIALSTKADVVSNQASAKTAIEPLESVKTISTYSLFGALGAGAVIILLTMMMIVRERRREIGVMKAIGSSNSKTILQFVSEAVTLTFLGLIVGTFIGIAAAQPITNVLVKNSSSSTASSQRGPGMGMGRLGSATSTALQSVKNVQASVGLSTVAYGIAIAFLIAVIGSAAPAYLISKVRPAEVMRAD